MAKWKAAQAFLKLAGQLPNVVLADPATPMWVIEQAGIKGALPLYTAVLYHHLRDPLPFDLLLRMATDRRVGARTNMARLVAELPIQVTTLLVRDPHFKVRAISALYLPADAGELFSDLATDRVPTVRANVVYNPRTPEDILKVLLADPAHWIRDQAVRSLDSRAGRGLLTIPMPTSGTTAFLDLHARRAGRIRKDHAGIP